MIEEEYLRDPLVLGFIVFIIALIIYIIIDIILNIIEKIGGKNEKI